MKMNLLKNHIFIWMFNTKTRFAAKAKDNSEVAYVLDLLTLTEMSIYPPIGREINLLSAMLTRDCSGRIINRGNLYAQNWPRAISNVKTSGWYSPITTLILCYYDIIEFIPRIEEFGSRVCCLNYESSKTPNETNSIALSRKENEKC